MRTLAPRYVAAVALGVTALDLAVWWFTGYAGTVVGVAFVVALLVVAGRRTREVGVSLVVAVLLAAFVVLLLATYGPRVRAEAAAARTSQPLPFGL